MVTVMRLVLMGLGELLITGLCERRTGWAADY